MKIHLREGSCKRGARGIQEEHQRFVELDINACLTCARICGCEECAVLRRDFGKVVTKGRAVHANHADVRALVLAWQPIVATREELGGLISSLLRKGVL